MNAFELSSIHEENYLKVLRFLEGNLHLGQRELANALEASLGKITCCLKALLGMALIKMQSFKKNCSKLAYAYWLTPMGVTEKTGLTVRFLTRKVAQCESLTLEVEVLTSAMSKAQAVRSCNRRYECHAVSQALGS